MLDWAPAGWRLSLTVTNHYLLYLMPLYFLAASLLVLTGAYKLWRPEGTSRVLVSAGVPSGGPVLARIIGASEVAFGGLALAAPIPLGAPGLVVPYLGFAAFLVYLVRFRPSVSSCGCAGAKDIPPSLLHATLDAVAGAIAVVVSLQAAAPDVVSYARSLGANWVLAVIACGLLAYALIAAVAYLPETWKSVSRVDAPHLLGADAREVLVDDVFTRAGIGPDHPSLFGALDPGASESVAP